MGIVTKVIAAHEWEKEVTAFAQKLASMPTKAISLIKQNVNKTWNSNLEEVLEEEAHTQQLAGTSGDHKEGVKAFMEKRRPEYKGV